MSNQKPIKINIDPDTGRQAKRPARARPSRPAARPSRPAAAKPPRRKAPARPKPPSPLKSMDKPRSREANKKTKNSSGDKSGGRLIYILITAAIVGGGIYYWQDTSREKDLSEIRNQAEEEKTSLENRINNLRNQLTNEQSKAMDLEAKTRKLEDQFAALGDATISFQSDELGFSAEYPVALGQLEYEIIEAKDGLKLEGELSLEENLRFGAVDQDYIATGSEPAADITETRGYDYEPEDEQYYFLGPRDFRVAVEPVEVWDLYGGNAIVLDKNSFTPDPAGDGLPVNIGQHTAAIINIDGEEFGGLAFVDTDKEEFGLDKFEEFMYSLTIY